MTRSTAKITPLFRALAVSTLLAGLAVACGDGKRDVVTGGATLYGGSVVAGDGVGWLVSYPPDGADGEVFEFSGGEPRRVADVDPITSLDTVGAGRRLVIGGLVCLDGSLREESTCAARMELRILEPDGTWEVLDLGRSREHEEPSLGFLYADAQKVVLSAPTSDDGFFTYDRGITEVNFDDLSTRSWNVEGPGVGVDCYVDGTLYDYTQMGGLLTPTPKGVESSSHDPVAVTYTVLAFRDGGWETAPNGTYEGTRPWVESLRCKPGGFTAHTSVVDTLIGWTPARGWFTDDLPLPVAEMDVFTRGRQGGAIPTPDGIIVETTPGDWEEALSAADVRQGLAPSRMALSATTVFACSEPDPDTQVVERCQAMPRG